MYPFKDLVFLCSLALSVHVLLYPSWIQCSPGDVNSAGSCWLIQSGRQTGQVVFESRLKRWWGAICISESRWRGQRCSLQAERKAEPAVHLSLLALLSGGPDESCDEDTCCKPFSAQVSVRGQHRTSSKKESRSWRERWSKWTERQTTTQPSSGPVHPAEQHADAHKHTQSDVFVIITESSLLQGVVWINSAIEYQKIDWSNLSRNFDKWLMPAIQCSVYHTYTLLGLFLFRFSFSVRENKALHDQQHSPFIDHFFPNGYRALVKWRPTHWFSLSHTDDGPSVGAPPLSGSLNQDETSEERLKEKEIAGWIN